MRQTSQVISPIDGRVVTTIEQATPGQIARCLDQARAALPGWAATPVPERVAIVQAFSEAMAARESELAELITLQMGRDLTLSQAIGLDQLVGARLRGIMGPTSHVEAYLDSQKGGPNLDYERPDV